MEVININSDFTNIPKLKERINLCLGYFDGVHIAHQRLINEAISYSNNKVGLITFSSSPKAKEQLTSLEGRITLFKILKIDYVFVFNFDKKIKNTSSNDFINNFLKAIDPHALICGNDFTFGKDKLGNVTELKKHFNVVVVPFLKKNNKKISSFDIANLLRNGKIKEANELLGRRYQVRGKVRSGYKHGHDLTFPTANISFASNYVAPLFGVYSVLIYINGIPHLGIANVGVHPTVNKLKKPIIEVHILNYSGDLYGKYVYIEFVDFIRKEKKFKSEKALINQINDDISFLKINYVI